ncbi:hypothetical protein ILUMI_01905, partial [Ignelater luminosus]
ESVVSKISQYELFSSIDLRSAYHQIPIQDEEKPYIAFEACGKLYQFCHIPFGFTNDVACFQRTIDSLLEKEKLKDTFAYLDDITVCGLTQIEDDQNLKRFLEVTSKYNLSLNMDKCKITSKSINMLGYSITKRSIEPDPDRLQPLLNLPLPNDTNSLRRIIGMFLHYFKWISRFSKKIQPLGRYTIPFTVEPVSDYLIAATLSRQERSVALFSRILLVTEQKQSSLKNEACAVVEASRKNTTPHEGYIDMPLVKEVELIVANPAYAHVKFPDRREDTVSVRHLAPAPQEEENLNIFTEGAFPLESYISEDSTFEEFDHD